MNKILKFILLLMGLETVILFEGFFLFLIFHEIMKEYSFTFINSIIISEFALHIYALFLFGYDELKRYKSTEKKEEW